ncbi:hypothetical protein B0H17DRAFT_1276897 [Mycena rosella]|uniref:Uncharacterized protein n=1 Tax=Mycena rosella TaxID=1033263 RepID=A0AAD7C6B2_MYCRO|nr:hypothetical protein B0H17DRAFT_1276897 [Mycena rosella]
MADGFVPGIVRGGLCYEMKLRRSNIKVPSQGYDLQFEVQYESHSSQEPSISALQKYHLMARMAAAQTLYSGWISFGLAWVESAAYTLYNGPTPEEIRPGLSDVQSVKVVHGTIGAMGGCDGTTARRWARRSSRAENPENPEAAQFTAVVACRRAAKGRQNAIRGSYEGDVRWVQWAARGMVIHHLGAFWVGQWWWEEERLGMVRLAFHVRIKKGNQNMAADPSGIIVFRRGQQEREWKEHQIPWGWVKLHAETLAWR